MLFHGIRALSRGFRLILASFQQSDSLPFADELTEEQIQAAFDEHTSCGDSHDEDEVFTPAVTLWGFLSQVLQKEEHRSCLAAVGRIGVMLVAMGRPRCAQNNGPYCRARARLPLVVIERLTVDIARRCEQQVPDDSLWYGHHIKLVDGTTVTMADTEENQEVFPQQTCQKEGLGFPIARMLVLLSLSTGMLHGMAMGPYQGKQTGELALFRELLDQLDAGDILLADKLFCTYFMIALLLERRVDVVARRHQSRDIDLRGAERLGKYDYLITWERPDRPDWMDQETYERMPETLPLRLIRVKISEPGFRTKSLDIVTTLTDAEEYGKEDLAQLYGRRWLVELDIRSIKVALGMDELRCKSPEMVRKEAWACLLAYNLVRQKMLQSALHHGVCPRSLSFTNALQVLAAGWMVMPLMDKQTQRALMEADLKSIASQRVGHRPGRVEPRAVKRRPKPFRLLTMPRRAAQALLRKGIDPYKKQR